MGPDWIKEADDYMREGFVESCKQDIIQQAKAERTAEILAIVEEVYIDLHFDTSSERLHKVGYNRFRDELKTRIQEATDE